LSASTQILHIWLANNIKFGVCLLLGIILTLNKISFKQFKILIMKQIMFFLMMLIVSYSLDAQVTNLGTGSGTSGVFSTHLGNYAGNSSLSSSESNTFVGASAGRFTQGSYNAIFGRNSGYANISGSANSFFGTNAGRYNDDGGHNTFIGASAGYENRSGEYNIYLGRQAGGQSTAGSNNVAIGYLAGFKAGNSNVFIGDRAGSDETGSNKLYIDNTGTTTPLIYGDFSNDQLTINGTLSIGQTPIPSNYKMCIDGKVIAEEMRVKPSNSWDEVFTEEYDLMTIEEKQQFTNQNHHLPSVEPEAIVVAEGIDIGKSYTDLLKEIEEAHLYIFQLNETVKELQKQMTVLKK